MNVTGRIPSNVVQYPGNRAGTGRTGGPTRYKASRKAAPSKVTPLYIWGDFDIPFLLLTLALLGFGLVMLFSASYARAYYYKDSSFYYIRRQIMWSIIGVVGMIAASFVNYHWLRRFVWPLYAVSIALCMACYLFEAENGANRWVRIGPVNFQPSEIAKFALILLFAHLMSRDQDKMDQLWLGPPVVPAGAARAGPALRPGCPGPAPAPAAAAPVGNAAAAGYHPVDDVCGRLENQAPDGSGYARRQRNGNHRSGNADLLC